MISDTTQDTNLCIIALRHENQTLKDQLKELASSNFEVQRKLLKDFMTQTIERNQTHENLESEETKKVLDECTIQNRSLKRKLKELHDNLKNSLASKKELSFANKQQKEQIRLLKDTVESLQNEAQAPPQMQQTQLNSELLLKNSELISQISELKSAVKSFAVEKENQKMLLAEKDSQLNNLQQKMELISLEKQKELENLMNKISELQTQNQLLQKKETLNRSTIAEMEKQIEIWTKSAACEQKRILQISCEIDSLANSNKSNEAEINQLKRLLQESTKENHNLKEECVKLNNITSDVQLKLEWKENENINLTRSIAFLEHEMTNQKNEIWSMNEEKLRLVEVIRKMLVFITDLEIYFSSPKSDKCLIFDNLKKAIDKSFDSPFKEQVIGIVGKYDSETVFMKIFEKIKPMKIFQITKPQEKSSTILPEVVQSLAFLLRQLSPFPNSRSVVEYIANELKKLSEFIPSSSSLFLGDLEQREKAIRLIAEHGWENETTFHFFMLLCEINIALLQQSEVLKQCLETSVNDVHQLLNAIGSSTTENAINEVIKFKERMANEANEIQQKNHKILKAETDNEHSQMKDQLKELTRKVTESDRIIEDLHLKQNSLQASLTKKVSQNMKLKNILSELHEKTEKINDIHKEELELLEKKNSEVFAVLQQKLANAEEEKKNLLVKLNIALKEFEMKNDAYSQREQQLLATIETLKSKKELGESNLLEKIADLQNKNREEFDSLASTQRQLELNLHESLSAMKVKQNEIQNLKKKLMKRKLKSCQQLESALENVEQLKTFLKASEVQIALLRDQMNRDRLVQQKDLTLKVLENDSQHQDEILKLKNENLAGKNSLILTVLKLFNEQPDTDESSIDQDAFIQIMTRVAEKLHQ